MAQRSIENTAETRFCPTDCTPSSVKYLEIFFLETVRLLEHEPIEFIS